MGQLGSFLKQSFPPKSNFTVEDIPDLTGKVIIVTGGNIGIGYETAKVSYSFPMMILIDLIVLRRFSQRTQKFTLLVDRRRKQKQQYKD